MTDDLRADLEGLYEQHGGMWGVYNDSIKLLVTACSLPILAAAVVISATEKDLDFAALPSAMRAALVVTPILVLPILGFVIHNRLVVLFYARAINGYRQYFLQHGTEEDRALFLQFVGLKMDKTAPPDAEWLGPMGLVVHGAGVINGLYLAAALYPGRWTYLCFLGVILVYEAWYAFNVYRPRTTHR